MLRIIIFLVILFVGIRVMTIPTISGNIIDVTPFLGLSVIVIFLLWITKR